MTDQDSIVDAMGIRSPSTETPPRRANRISLRIVLVYLGVAVVWIVGSDAFLAWLKLDSTPAAYLSAVKGLGFVLVTALILYWRMFETIVGLESTRRDLSEVQERFRRAILDAPIPVSIIADDGQVVLLNRAWLQETGYRAEEIKTVRDWTDRAFGDRSSEIAGMIHRLFRIDHRFDEGDLEIRVHDGTSRYWSSSSAPLGRLNDGRKLLISMARDVTERRRVEDELRLSEERFRFLVESAPEGIYIQTRQRFSYVNPAAVELFGVSSESELIGHPVIERFHERDRASILSRIQTLDRDRNRLGTVERTILRPDGGLLQAEVDAMPFEFEGEPGALVFLRDVSERKRAERALTVSSNRLRDLTHRLQTIQEEERRHLSRELHDQVGQCLTAIKMNIETAQLSPGRMTVRLDEAKAMLDQTLDQVRALSLDLRPSILDDLGLVPALRWYIEGFSARTTIESRFRAVPEGIVVAPEVATACFRSVQEALTNVARHSKADRVSVELAAITDCLDLIVRDNGRGFVPGEVQGLGLIGMRERVEHAGGSVELRSAPGSGTDVHITFSNG